jgi:hypothetical protein
MAFIAGLNTAAVSRLKWTKKELSRRSIETLQELEKFMSNEMNYKHYRSHIASSSSATVLYLGVHLSDLTFIEEGNPDFLDNYLINFERRQLVGDVVQQIQKCQLADYNLTRVPRLIALLTNLPAMSEKHLYQLSLKREPRGAIPPDLELRAKEKKQVKDGFDKMKKRTEDLAYEVRKLDGTQMYNYVKKNIT